MLSYWIPRPLCSMDVVSNPFMGLSHLPKFAKLPALIHNSGSPCPASFLQFRCHDSPLNSNILQKSLYRRITFCRFHRFFWHWDSFFLLTMKDNLFFIDLGNITLPMRWSFMTKLVSYELLWIWIFFYYIFYTKPPSWCFHLRSHRQHIVWQWFLSPPI